MDAGLLLSHAVAGGRNWCRQEFECLRRGRDVPGRITVMGFGDMSIARAASPQLSTVRIRRFEMESAPDKCCLHG